MNQSQPGIARPAPPRARAATTFAASLTFAGVEHAYGHVPSVRGVTLEIAPGEVVCLLGQSGCGKSTLLRLAAGLEQPTGGRILIGGREVASATSFVEPEQRGVGLMFQDYALFPHMTILANVMFGLNAMPRAEAEREAIQALARVGMESYILDYPHELSGGQQQRVALARAIAPRPAVLLMDEPFSGLDKRLRDSVREETMMVLRETRATSMVVTHDPEEAMRMGDRVALMRAGQLIQVGSADDLYQRPIDLFVAGFFSELNVLPGTSLGGRIETALGPAASARPDGQAVDVALRPAMLRVARAGDGTLGRVVARRFLGDVDLVHIAVAGLDDPVQARVHPSEQLVPGTDVRVSFAPQEALVFERRG